MGVAVAIGGGLVLLGVIFVLLYVRSRRLAAASQSWESVPGRVTSATIKTFTDTSENSSGDSYEPRVTYEYAVSGKNYKGSRIRFGSASNGDRSEVEKVLANYPEGGTVTVYYNPAKPDQAVLERSAAGSSAFLIVGIIFLVMGAYAGVYLAS